MSVTNPHHYADRIGLALDQEVAARIRADPSLIEVAKRNLNRWREQNGGVLGPAHQEWERVLRFLRPAQIADFIVSRAPMAARLSQSSPFAGILTDEERLEILQNHAASSA